MRKLIAKARELSTDTSGGTLILTAFSMVVILGSAALATDAGIWYLTERAVQAGADAASLAGAYEIGDPNSTDSDVEAAVLVGAEKNGFSAANGDDVQVTILPNDGGVQVTISRPTRLFFSSVVISDAPVVRATATAAPRVGSMELALVLDVSGSMKKDMVALKDAAQNLIDVIFGDAETLPSVWVTVIPFSGRVNILDYGATWMQNWPSGDAIHLCVGLRSMPYQANDEPPSTELFPDYVLPPKKPTCPETKALGLTAEKSTIKSHIAAMTTTHGTSTHRGLVWGWRALSPKWQGEWGNAELPNPYNGPIPKVAIIMTDGQNHPDQSGDPYTTAEADQLLLQECTEMKALGITIYSVVFKEDKNNLFQLYTDCASPGNAFKAVDAAALFEAFTKIGGALRTVRLVQ